ncbi:MAG: orotate phosphoribosyltransferase [Patescibacteria group bacterium]|nr:orotate phosphoribosyltransferase [Patescibacteria group bacterium]
MYLDLRILVTYPKILQVVAQEYIKILKKLTFDRLAGIPYTAIPIATAVSLFMNKPMIYTRKEVKEYGTKKTIEGEFEKGEKVVVIDDLITTGASKLEVIQPLVTKGLKVSDIVVFIDRDQGGKEQLEDKGYHFYSILHLTEMITILETTKILSKEKAKEVMDFLVTHRV